MGDRCGPAARPMVVAVCAFHVENVRRHLHDNLRALDDDEYLVVLDRPSTAKTELVAQEVRAAGGTMRVLGATSGLSASRNTVLADRPGRHILFVDDDVRLDAGAVDAVRTALREGAHMTGVRLCPPAGARRSRWYFTSGQYHLVGWHRPEGPIKIWGACMGVDAAYAHAHGLRFDPALSRTGGNLLSGEDTTFLSLMRRAGGRDRLLPDQSVVHDVEPSRLRLRYLLRRAYWQGRSEVNRRQAWAGLRKEWDRHRTAPESPVAWVLACLYGAITFAGIVAGARDALRDRSQLRARTATTAGSVPAVSAD